MSARKLDVEAFAAQYREMREDCKSHAEIAAAMKLSSAANLKRRLRRTGVAEIPEPSGEEMWIADYLHFRSFGMSNNRIADKMGVQLDSLEVRAQRWGVWKPHADDCRELVAA